MQPEETADVRSPVAVVVRVLRRLIIVGLLATSLSACGGGSGTSTDAARQSGPAEKDGTGAAAPASFSTKTLDGSTFAVPTGKPTVIFFMAGWCSSCIPEAQALDRVERSEGDKVAILAVDTDPAGSDATLADFVRAAGSPRYGFAPDREGHLTKSFSVRALDTTVVLDAAGRVVFRDAVPTDEDTLRGALLEAGLQTGSGPP